MTTRHLPVDTWIVVEQEAAWKHLALVSQHKTQAAAEVERDRRNSSSPNRRYRACLIVEPVAQQMGGHGEPVTRQQ